MSALLGPLIGWLCWLCLQVRESLNGLVVNFNLFPGLYIVHGVYRCRNVAYDSTGHLAA